MAFKKTASIDRFHGTETDRKFIFQQLHYWNVNDWMSTLFYDFY
ncbi:hypothetical protein LEP1GSC021_3706 [Leptospira noguchii str. 1993005606]|nr:hypothetical protein LEP1GSC021_3706 [Leptospira noguchii str. 1993005606]